MKLGCSVHFSVMGIVAKTKQNKNPARGSKKNSQWWYGANSWGLDMCQMGACTPGMSSASVNFCSEQCEAFFFNVKSGASENMC